MAVQKLQFCSLVVLVVGLGLLQWPLSVSSRDFQKNTNLGYKSLPSPSSSGIDFMDHEIEAENFQSLYKFLNEPHHDIGIEGENVSVPCQPDTTGGKATISWLYNYKPLPQNDSRWEILQNELRIIAISESENRTNTGEYGCVAKYKAGTLESRYGNVQVAIMNDTSMVTSATNISIETQYTILYCGITSKPSAEIQWIYNDEILLFAKNSRLVLWPSGTLIIENTKLSDSGRYRCIAHNPLMNKTVTSSDFELNVTSASANIEEIPAYPLLIDNLNYIAVLNGTDVKHFCLGVGWPTPIVKWVSEAGKLINQSSYLIFEDSLPRHTGTYACEVWQHGLSRETIIRINVYRIPTFLEYPPERIVIHSAQTIRISCKVRGVPDPRVVWSKDGVILKQDSRTKIRYYGLILANSVTGDSGIYQCKAINSANIISAATGVEIAPFSDAPLGPRNIKCRSMNSTKLCLTWEPPFGTKTEMYYSLFSSTTDEIGNEVNLVDYMTSKNYYLVEELRNDTNYTFYLRTYSQHPSDEIHNISCTTVEVIRNINVKVIDENKILITWNKISPDTSCNGTESNYFVQWYRYGTEIDQDLNNINEMEIASNKMECEINDLLPGFDYKIRVLTINSLNENWITYTRSPTEEEQTTDDNDDGTDGTPQQQLPKPRYLFADKVTPTLFKISWSRVANAKYYMVCFLDEVEKRDCRDEEFRKSKTTNITINHLEPQHVYLVRVRAHDSNKTAGFLSDPLKIRLLGDLSSPVTELDEYTFNATSICLQWKKPESPNGLLKKYLVTVPMNEDWSFMANVTNYEVELNEKTCNNSEGVISVLLTNLSVGVNYLAVVRVENDIGLGQPAPITFNIALNDDDDETSGLTGLQKSSITIEILFGLAACLGIVAGAFAVRGFWVCLKRRSSLRDNNDDVPPRSANYHGIAQYNSEIERVEIRTPESCSVLQPPEIQHLVAEEEEEEAQISAKSANNYPVSKADSGLLKNTFGLNKIKKFNDNGASVRITENPHDQYYAVECNGNLTKNKSEPLLRQKDNNNSSNNTTTTTMTTKPFSKYYYEFYKLFDSTKKQRNNKSLQNFKKGSIYSSCKGGDEAFNNTEVTFLES